MKKLIISLVLALSLVSTKSAQEPLGQVQSPQQHQGAFVQLQNILSGWQPYQRLTEEARPETGDSLCQKVYTFIQEICQPVVQAGQRSVEMVLYLDQRTDDGFRHLGCGACVDSGACSNCKTGAVCLAAGCLGCHTGCTAPWAVVAHTSHSGTVWTYSTTAGSIALFGGYVCMGTGTVSLCVACCTSCSGTSSSTSVDTPQAMVREAPRRSRNRGVPTPMGGLWLKVDGNGRVTQIVNDQTRPGDPLVPTQAPTQAPLGLFGFDGSSSDEHGNSLGSNAQVVPLSPPVQTPLMPGSHM